MLYTSLLLIPVLVLSSCRSTGSSTEVNEVVSQEIALTDLDPRPGVVSYDIDVATSLHHPEAAIYWGNSAEHKFQDPKSQEPTAAITKFTSNTPVSRYVDSKEVPVGANYILVYLLNAQGVESLHSYATITDRSEAFSQKEQANSTSVRGISLVDKNLEESKYDLSISIKRAIREIPAVSKYVFYWGEKENKPVGLPFHTLIANGQNQNFSFPIKSALPPSTRYVVVLTEHPKGGKHMNATKPMSAEIVDNGM